jgi:hypothetical protein
MASALCYYLGLRGRIPASSVAANVLNGYKRRAGDAPDIPRSPNLPGGSGGHVTDWPARLRRLLASEAAQLLSR